MVPDGFFKVWVNNKEELRAVCEELEVAGIFWGSGDKATDFIPSVIPLGLEIGYYASRNVVSSRHLTYNTNFNNWKSREHFNADIYAVDDIVGDAFDVSSCNVSSVFSVIEY